MRKDKRHEGGGGVLREREAWKQERCHEGSAGMKEGQEQGNGRKKI